MLSGVLLLRPRIDVDERLDNCWRALRKELELFVVQSLGVGVVLVPHEFGERVAGKVEGS